MSVKDRGRGRRGKAKGGGGTVEREGQRWKSGARVNGKGK